MREIEGRKELAIEATKEAGKILMDNFGRPIKTKRKADGSLVTDVDLRVDDKITKLIKRDCPEDNILSEESDHRGFSSKFKWIIDPLDGTHNYVRNIEIFGTSIALEFKGEVVLGLIYIPATEEFYIAQKGKGAYLNGRRINVSKRNLSQATMIYDSRIRYNKKPMLASLEKFLDKVFNMRMFGSTARSLSYLAEGKVDLEIEYTDKVWDFAAGFLLVEEAGGRATDLQGRRWSTNTQQYIVSNRIVHKEALSIMKGTLSS
ncbi:inositol monophosphatase [bacterium]|nr:inositol monophosphatase [bacterium]